jgi:class 3 adenylate cyclase
VAPQTLYARSGDVNIAYQVIGEGPLDLVYVPGWVTNVEVMWEEPGLAGFLKRLATFSRVITFDKRGIGLSDPVPTSELPDLETRVDDLRAVMKAAGSESAVMFGHSEGGSAAISLAARYPSLVSKLILFSAYAKRLKSDDYPWAPTAEERRAQSESFAEKWADPQRIAEYYGPSRADDEAFVEWVGRWLRLSASPAAAAALNDASTSIDVTDLLPEIRVPTLLLYRIEDLDVNVEEGRYIASRIPGAKLVELHGADHFFYAGDTEPILEEIEEFVTGHRVSSVPQRSLQTVLFTDIVGSTETAAAMGDDRWRDLIGRHNDATRAELRKWRGREVVTTGDGFLATFEGPADAIRCADAIIRSVRRLGIEVRCGIHTGVVEIIGDDVTGLAVNIGARVAALAAPSQVVVSRTVKDLLAGTSFEFEDMGTHSLKGVPDEWQVYSVAV